MKLRGKVAIVTGASKGIGAACALELAREGASVVVNYATSKDGAMRVVDEIIKMGGKAIAVQANVADPLEIKRLFNEALEVFKRLDILVNNAGIYEEALLKDISIDHYDRMFNLNVMGVLFASQEAAKCFSDAGGSIVNISSIASSLNTPPYLVYNATKAAVDSITSTLAKELGSRNIRVNAINPGMVETEGTHATGVMEDIRKAFEPHIALGRIGKPEDLTKALIFLVSDDSSWMTGECMVISGGVVPF
ncbi:MAG: glucose 1-dehydrogenase [Verrucomicrobia bacterium]|nr:glucose 1-dehydrogenase [Verrucomicrobiota bacterium]MBS0636947.1 glucose 1-dehydrogenase [Verrucomicrobiota bacterium]